ncbi:MAG: hypothetical protein QUS66_11665, partial [Bacteroidota bacterium]|nr:hypothetical protein [Bacteroidota bacterium]
MIEGKGKWTALSRQSDWNWSGKTDTKDMKRGIPYRISFRVKLENGDTFSSVQNFIISEADSINQTAKVPLKDPFKPVSYTHLRAHETALCISDA